MYRPKQKNKEQYGSFGIRTGSGGNNKIKIFGSAAVLVCAVIIILAFTVFNKSKDNEQVSDIIDIPDALASSLPGWWYMDYFGSSVCEQDRCMPNADPDNDKLTNAQEFYFHSNPLSKDTNSNGLSDGEDVAQNYDPSKPGKVSFDEAVTDESILGESLVFNEDVKKIINESVNPQTLVLPEISDLELNITSDNSQEAFEKYITESNEAVAQYFPKDRALFIEEVMLSENAEKVSDLQYRFTQALIDLKKVPVPSEALALHKAAIGFLSLMPDVVSVPDSAALQDEYNPVGNLWYDKTQTALKFYQQMELEIQKLKAKSEQ